MVESMIDGEGEVIHEESETDQLINEFVERCESRIAQIASNNETGYYAKMYHEDVGQWLSLYNEDTIFALSKPVDHGQDAAPVDVPAERVTVPRLEQRDNDATTITLYVVAIDGADRFYSTTNLSKSWLDNLRKREGNDHVRVFAVVVPLGGVIQVDNVIRVKPEEVVEEVDGSRYHRLEEKPAATP